MTRPMLTQREAAAACGVSRTTIRRRREAGELPHAVQDPERGWMVPVDDLLAAGFRLNAPAPADQAAPAPADPAAPSDDAGRDAAVLRAELARLNAEHALALAEARFGQKLAEAEAEHLRRELAARGEHIADLQRAMGALTSAPERPALTGPVWPAMPGQAQGDPGEAGEAESEPRKRWWGGQT
ncbi:helix-turn-helix transcriptional regulator [Streptomyces virginiae]|uniref:helix-turn-helix transcriptional regulator n=1 Tax=Streptomyces virginiae TaxID=1961 RepID=UPI0037B5193F